MSPGTLAKRGVLLAITALSLYLLAPALLEVFGAYDKLDEFNPLWWVAMVILQIGSYACMWGVQKLSMRAERWGPVITSQLASNSFGRVVPGGVAASGAMQYAMLARGGVPSAQAASGMTASSVLVFGILLALPLLALPAVLFGAPVDPGLGRAALIGGVVFVLLCAAGAAAILWDRPLLAVGPGGPVGAQPDPAQARPADGTCRSACCASATRCARCSARAGGRRCCWRRGAGCSTT